MKEEKEPNYKTPISIQIEFEISVRITEGDDKMCSWQVSSVRPLYRICMFAVAMSHYRELRWVKGEREREREKKEQRSTSRETRRKFRAGGPPTGLFWRTDSYVTKAISQSNQIKKPLRADPSQRE